jgi:ribosomal RNA-processing protein 17
MGKNVKKRPRQQHKKVVVGFDEDERADYLTGFRKRKTQRREQAIVEMVEKARKDKLIERKERRAKQSYQTTMPTDSDNSDDEDKVEQVSYTDDFSKQQFGASNVTVTTVIGFDGEDSDEDVDSLRDKLLARQKVNKQKNLLNEEKRLVKSQEARVKRMKEVMLKSKRKSKKKGSKAKRVSGKKHSRGKRR